MMDDKLPREYAELANTLRRLRTMMGMDVVFVSEFVDDKRTFRYVDARSADCPLKAGDAGPLSESFCLRVADGRLPRLIEDVSALPPEQSSDAARSLDIRTHLSIPIVLHSGKVFGTLCCFSQVNRVDVSDKDRQTLQAMADFIAAGVDRHGLFRSSVW